jgi:hypothetical protein
MMTVLAQLCRQTAGNAYPIDNTDHFAKRSSFHIYRPNHYGHPTVFLYVYEEKDCVRSQVPTAIVPELYVVTSRRKVIFNGGRGRSYSYSIQNHV